MDSYQQLDEDGAPAGVPVGVEDVRGGTVDVAHAEVGSFAWWLARLIGRLRIRSVACREYGRFYEGVQPLAFASDKFQEVFGRRYSRLPANFMPLVVDAEAERLVVQGFRWGTTPEADKGVWRVWQDNQLDAESQIAHEIALSKGIAYALVTPTSDGPLVTIEDPEETILETDPGNRRIRRAALKSWRDDDGYVRATLYLPDGVYRFRSTTRRTDESSWSWQGLRWRAYVDDPDEPWPGPNPLGEVPVIALPNRPRRDGTGRSEVAPVMGNQNAINKIRFDALVASEFVAFPQRWATNIDVPIDPATGQPVAPFRPGVDVIWVARRPTPEESAEYGDRFPQPGFGQFPAADLDPYINLIRSEVGAMSSISRTPYHYLLGEPTSVPPTGESIKSSEAPLVRKTGKASVYLGEGWEETMRLCLVAQGQRSKARSDAETIWADPETRNEASRADTLVKLQTIGVPPEVLWEMAGLSPTQIQRINDIRNETEITSGS